METPSTPEPLTLGAVARILRVRKHTLKYALEEHPVPPAGRVGITRYWDVEQLPMIRAAIASVGRTKRRTDR